MFHIAWGGLLCTQYMRALCPEAKPFGVMRLPTFTTLGASGPIASAGIRPKAAIWHISQKDAERLDSEYELIEGMVRATTIFKSKGVEFPASIYLATSAKYALEFTMTYLHMIRKGYDEWGFPQSDLDEVVSLLGQAVAA